MKRTPRDLELGEHLPGQLTIDEALPRPRLLDLFCGEGGAAAGYHAAGFDVVGVDLDPQPRYPFGFIRGDALDVLADPGFLAGFDAVHASPPCQAYANVTKWTGDQADHPDLVPPVRALLTAQHRPWIIENVVGAPIRPDYVLCGSQFGLRVRRHRWFETSWAGFSLVPPCTHPRDELPFGHKGERAYADALGGAWMSNRGGRQAIPPAYTEYLGRLLAQQLGAPPSDVGEGAA
jgi:C-5 cytosine-specific DNA methylase